MSKDAWVTLTIVVASLLCSVWFQQPIVLLAGLWFYAWRAKKPVNTHYESLEVFVFSICFSGVLLMYNRFCGLVFQDDPTSYITHVAIGAGLACWAVHRLRERTDLLSIVGFAVLIVFQFIISFAVFYAQNGLLDVDGKTTNDYETCIYFSLVTWTTLGYGDFRPTEQIRMVAGFEALLGYILMGAFLATCLEMRTTKEENISANP